MTAGSAAALVADDVRLMAAAIALGDAARGTTWPNPAVGALVVRVEDGRPVIVGRGWTQAGGRPHAEPGALAMAGAAARGATLYVSLEPCAHFGKTPPCTEAIIQAGIARVVAAVGDPDPRTAGAGFAKLEAAGIEVVRDVLRAEGERSHAGHIRRVRDGRPHVMLKLAVSADGKAGLAGPHPAAITSEAARARVHMLRALNDAIMVGIGTALADDPELTCRLPGLAARSPVRVVLDPALKLPLSSRLVATAGTVPLWLIAGADADVDRDRALTMAGAEVMRVGRGADGRLDLAEVLRLLALRGITRLMVEGGPTLAAALLGADLVDEAVVFGSNVVLGDDALPALAGLPLTALTAAPALKTIERVAVGADTMTVSRRI
ncbi:bifunctional diaminohydroxyphosphoribosylaminopyrimidine deaminase/5-amino-6-(5-phosphoribosylamino)uracil reductase RibD [Blastochloris viridis]|uniref:Riboflavin biosynthesis protein RibD n=1 Tax=Blastochloris viridis TaxID=1079 RepID=A0A0H5BG82_BLAVI|nr:bifunctional diaminohydroxyphosphoribosylaminopyrimidine deaminase/5-amino-6-(5-phosphoribosylamino)uracil reductase RibD [Blastochloris viridis]ALK09956.1 Riboflavin biosynthesis protein RibD [Blastochloris viridis]BAS00135.1 diaminohydroxyphosphoribosylaminopyrimidine deaminase [Blastochloris viridis]CUU42619.1 Riboflavin biosynthesis protein RibD [Blastochloris viridis]